MKTTSGFGAGGRLAPYIYINLTIRLSLSLPLSFSLYRTIAVALEKRISPVHRAFAESFASHPTLSFEDIAFNPPRYCKFVATARWKRDLETSFFRGPHRRIVHSRLSRRSRDNSKSRGVTRCRARVDDAPGSPGFSPKRGENESSRRNCAALKSGSSATQRKTSIDYLSELVARCLRGRVVDQAGVR